MTSKIKHLMFCSEKHLLLQVYEQQSGCKAEFTALVRVSTPFNQDDGNVPQES